MQLVNVATIPRAERILRRAQCPASIVLGDCVSVVGPKVGRLLDVALADPAASPYLPAIGIVTRKYSATLCRVQCMGPLLGIYTGLCVGRTYYLSATGRLTLTPPASPAATQAMGVAWDDDEFLIHWREELAGGTAADLVFGEVPSGPVNGTNRAFATAYKFQPGSEAFYFCGVRMVQGAGEDYIISESGGAGTGYDTITVTRPVPPRAGDELLVDYLRK